MLRAYYSPGVGIMGSLLFAELPIRVWPAATTVRLSYIFRQVLRILSVSAAVFTNSSACSYASLSEGQHNALVYSKRSPGKKRWSCSPSIQISGPYLSTTSTTRSKDSLAEESHLETVSLSTSFQNPWTGVFLSNKSRPFLFV